MSMVATQLSFTVCSSSLTLNHYILPLHVQENLAELSPLSEVFPSFLVSEEAKHSLCSITSFHLSSLLVPVAALGSHVD